MKKFIVKILVLLTVFTAVLGVGAACKDKAPGKPVEHVITFYVDGEEYATLSTSGNEGLTLPENPQKTGFEFDGWYMGSEQNIPFSKDSFTSETLTENIAVYAKWTVETYDITFVGVKGENTNKTTFTIEDEDIILSDLSCDGYTFDGWYNGSTKVTKIAKGTFGNITLTAKWAVETYNITFVGVKGENTNKTTFTIEDEDIILSDLSCDGYTFDGWYNGSTKVTKIAKGTFGNIMLTAKWTLTEYVVTFKLDGKEIGTTTYTIENKNITLPTVDDKKGYTVVWDNYTLTTGDITINAYYQAINVTVTFDYDGADGNNTVTQIVIGYDETISLPEPIKTDYTFNGWYLDGEKIISGSVWKIAKNCTLVASWTKNAVTPPSTGDEYTRVDGEGNESSTGSYVYFGSYPQSDVTSSMSTVLADKVAALPTSENSNGWTSYKYYIESSNETDFMWYKDVEYSGSKYRAVYFTSYRPEKTSYDSSKYDTYQDDNGYNISNVYWFKYEPIKWRILEESNGKATLLAEMILDSQDYNYTSSSRTIDGKTVYSNNYEYSNIRKWLNDNFYNTAFSELEKALIQTVEVDNSARSTNLDNNATEWNSGVNSYACNNTNDKVWLLSQQEVTRASYGFATSPYTHDTVRQKKMTAYSQCQGVYTSTEPDYVGNGYWWLRSPNCNYNSSMRGSSCYGTSSSSQDVREILYGGVVPALQISLFDLDEGASGGESTTATYKRVDDDGNESETGSYVYFGSYPQTDVTASMSTVLADKVATLPTSENSNGWTSYGYYIENSNATNYMWYKDVEHGGSKYRAVYFTSYRPFGTDNSSSTENTFQDDNGYYTSNVYWFKYEPIKWRILEESNGKATLLAEMILDSQDYNYTISSTTIDGKTVYANNYEYSSIRSWLNDNFYNTAFSELEKVLIQTVEVDNSARSTSPDTTLWNNGVNTYACNNTNDKVWLLSEQEVTRESYGFATSTGETTTRQKKTTAYGKCQGCWTNTANYVGNGYWWLRSPSYNYNYRSSGVDRSGNLSIYDYVNCAYFGVVPALQISL